MNVADRAGGEPHGEVGDVVGADLEAGDAIDDGAHLDDLSEEPAHVVDRVALVEQAPPALLGIGHVELAVVLAGVTVEAEMVRVLGPRRADGADPTLLQELLDQEHRRPIAPVVRDEHAAPSRVTELQKGVRNCLFGVLLSWIGVGRRLAFRWGSLACVFQRELLFCVHSGLFGVRKFARQGRD